MYLQNLFDDVVENEEAEDALAGQYEEIKRRDVAQEFDCTHVIRRDCSSSWRILYQKPIQQPDQLQKYDIA